MAKLDQVKEWYGSLALKDMDNDRYQELLGAMEKSNSTKKLVKDVDALILSENNRLSLLHQMQRLSLYKKICRRHNAN